LWGERQRHKDPNLGHVDCEPVAIPAPKLHRKTVEFLWAGNYGTHSTYGISQYEQILQYARCGHEIDA
ncbi:hypothetical protein EJ73_02651, partial [Hoylesella shahii DSM 15611 = JCM 12083]